MGIFIVTSAMGARAQDLPVADETRPPGRIDVSGGMSSSLWAALPVQKDLAIPAAWQTHWRWAFVQKAKGDKLFVGLNRVETSQYLDAVEAIPHPDVATEPGSVVWVAPDDPSKLDGTWSVKAQVRLVPVLLLPSYHVVDQTGRPAHWRWGKVLKDTNSGSKLLIGMGSPKGSMIGVLLATSRPGVPDSIGSLVWVAPKNPENPGGHWYVMAPATSKLAVSEKP